MRPIYLLLATLFFYGQSCYAGFDDGNVIYDRLGDWRKSNPTNIVSASAGIGYVSGVYDALDGITFCSPGNVTRNQIGDIVYNYLRDNPQVRQKDASILVSNALKQAFPCKK